LTCFLIIFVKLISAFSGIGQDHLNSTTLPTMKVLQRLLVVTCFTILFLPVTGQDEAIHPTLTGTGTYWGLTPPLRDLPVISEEEFRAMEANAGMERNRDLERRSYPYAKTALPKGPDPVWQREMGSTHSSRGLILNFNGQTSPYYPPDANGAVGPLYYMQTINCVYAIYDKVTGATVAGPTNMNQLFTGVTGSNCNDGDPILLYDEQADRWLAVEFSICSSNDRMLIAVSQTNDPTGSWHKYSFDVSDLPDYPKFGIWQDGYYMGDNNTSGNDIYVFERAQMLVGGTAQFIGFNNQWRPSTIDGFVCVPPVDNDGVAAPAGEPALFIAINDDAIGGFTDALWIYELDPDWTNTSNSTFNRVQQLQVPAFDSNFGNNWNNIKQPGTSQRLDAIPMVIMNRPQYRNFGAYETIVCCHTVDLDATNHAGIRWYELRRNGGDWSVRQSGTFGPDEHNRWMGSVALNGDNQIGLAYSISSITEYPGIRFCGQSATEYANASGVLDIAEAIIQTGANSQTGTNRWGDYADLSVDPDNDHTFWFTTQYPGGGGSRLTKISSFEFSPAALNAMFTASTLTPCIGGTVNYTDQSAGTPASWNWTFEGGTPATSTSQNPEVSYSTPGTYDVQLIISDGSVNDTLTETDFIQVLATPGQAAVPSGPADVCKGDNNVQYTTFSVPDATSYTWTVNPPEAGTFTGTDTTATLAVSGIFAGAMRIKVQATNNCGSGSVSDSLLVNVHNGPTQYNMIPDGGFCEGSQGFEVILDGSETTATYELFRNDTTTNVTLPGYGDTLSFGYWNVPGIYSIQAHSFTCSIGMNNTTNLYYLTSVEVAAAPTGSAEECNSSTDSEYTTTGAVNATSYAWHLDPVEAGTVTGSSTTGYVSWSADFTGTAFVMVQGVNDCGTGPMSDGFEVSVIMAPHPAISGESEVCNASAGNVYFYNTPDNPGNSYDWSITGGNIMTGQGTHQVLVTWSGLGAASLGVFESSQLGCSTDAEPLQVTIFDCTGISENAGNRVTVFPNPVKDELTLKCDLAETGTARLIIFNHFGQEVLSREVNSMNGRVDLTLSTAGMASGTYSVKIISAGGKMFAGKFLKAD
jgi:PKD repeat protein